MSMPRIVEYLEGVRAHRHVVVAEAQEAELVGGEVREALDACGVVVRHGQDDLVLHEV